MNIKNRNISLDLIRCFALFSVISVHFFDGIGYYQEKVLGFRMLLMTITRNFFMICVPLFIILSGYLMIQKTLSKKYYFRILEILIIYILTSIVCLLFRKYYLNQEITVLSGFFSILNFSADSYSWYIEMYFGLFLLIPFLNILYNNLDCKKSKLILITTLIILTCLPSVLNIYNFDTEGWWVSPTLSNDFMKLIPEWWCTIYPLTYYFIGAYIKEYKIEIKRNINILIILFLTFIFGLFNIYRSYGNYLIWGGWQSYNSIFILLLAVFVFIFFLNMNLENISINVKKLLCNISNLSLGAYLSSWIFDNLIYPQFNLIVIDPQLRFNYFFIIVPIIFIASLMLSLVLNTIFKLIVKILNIK